MNYENLQLGDTGDDVKILQEKLKILNYYNAIITGSFGLATEVGVKAFQRDNNLEDTGIVDKETWNKIVEYTSPSFIPISFYPTLKLGSSGSYVEDLQTKLKSLLYYTGKITGQFDLETQNAVKRFQLNNELTADGVVGNQTWKVLNSVYGNISDCALINDLEQETTYTVVSGDTLYGIAKKYNTTVDAIKELNNLMSNTLRVGQILKIPETSSDEYVMYTVVSGDKIFMGNNE